MKKLLLLFALAALSFAAANGQNLKPEEIVAKHLDAVGAKEKRDEKADKRKNYGQRAGGARPFGSHSVTRQITRNNV